MKILSGLASGALLQRDEQNLCRCYFRASTQGILRTTRGEIHCLADGRYLLQGIPVGGPHALALYDDVSRIELTVWVGDLWLLGGQSNMEGAGRVTEEVREEMQHKNESIRCYSLDNRWTAATPITHEPWLSADACVGEVWRRERRESLWGNERPNLYQGKEVGMRAVGPGYDFAKRMHEITQAPQAVIPCALGGSSMRRWLKGDDPCGDNGCLYALMLRRFEECGGFVRGLYWDQGESDVSTPSLFAGKMQKFITDLRADTCAPRLPIVQTQIAKTAVSSLCSKPEHGINWTRIREEQRLLDRRFEQFVTVSAIDADYDDLIHYSSAFQKTMGIRAANAMADLLGLGGAPVPIPYRITYSKSDDFAPFNYVFEIHYQNVQSLSSVGVPSGFAVLSAGYEAERICNPSVGVQRIELCGNVVRLFTEIRTDPESASVIYGFGHMAYCNIITDTGYAIPAMGPICAKEMNR